MRQVDWKDKVHGSTKNYLKFVNVNEFVYYNLVIKLIWSCDCTYSRGQNSNTYMQQRPGVLCEHTQGEWTCVFREQRTLSYCDWFVCACVFVCARCSLSSDASCIRNEDRVHREQSTTHRHHLISVRDLYCRANAYACVFCWWLLGRRWVKADLTMTRQLRTELELWKRDEKLPR